MPLIDYAVNYNFIVKNLCENRTKPQLMCNGKCYLAKEFAKTTGNTSKQENSKITIPAFTDSFIVGTIITFSNYCDNIIKNSKQQNSYLALIYHFSLDSGIFHPPLG
jgi:hypothetical protein